MKTILPLLLSATAALATGGEQPELRKQFRDAATHEQLAHALRKAEQRDPMKKREAVAGEDPSKVNRPVNLLEQSDIISFRGLATLVPKQAILAVPPRYKQLLAAQPGDRFVGWADFYARNRGWITTVEVSRIQAEGNQEIPQETREQIGKSTNLVVATYQSGPISVLPLKKAEPPVETVATKP